MSVKATQQSCGARASLVVWSGLSASEPGDPVSLVDYPSMTVTIEGGEAELRGSNRGDPEGFPLTDMHGLPLKGDGMWFVVMNPWRIWPVVRAGGPVTVTILASRGA